MLELTGDWVNKRLSRALRYARTLRYLRPVQIYGRIWFRLYRPRPDLRAAPARRQPRQAYLPPPRPPASLVAPDTFVFLNQTGSVSQAADWNHPDADTLWLYNLHYFDDLNAADADARRGWHDTLLQRWVVENPPGQGVGWDPYPTSLRIVNWIQWSLRGGELPASAVASLAVQARWLRRRLEYHLLGNHLFANAKALVFAGLYFEGGEADAWRAKGLSILRRELAEQVLDDGGHFERSPMYHLILLEDCLDLINIMRAFGREAPGEWLVAAAAMMQWARIMQHPDGGIPFFNDAVFGIAPEPAAVLDYGARLGVGETEVSEQSVTALRFSGYVRLADERATVFFDAAPVGPDYLPGHAHADTLSIEASFDGQRVLVNSGTSVYGTSAERLRQRGTAAHNTIRVDGRDSSEVWSGFRVARRARVRDLSVDAERGHARAWHDGYTRLRGKPRHYRDVWLQSGVLTVADQITGRGLHTVEGRWYLHPAVRIVKLDTRRQEAHVHLQTRVGGDSRDLMLTVSGAEQVEIAAASHHPRFGVAEECQCLVYTACGRLPVAIRMMLAPVSV